MRVQPVSRRVVADDAKVTGSLEPIVVGTGIDCRLGRTRDDETDGAEKGSEGSQLLSPHTPANPVGRAVVRGRGSSCCDERSGKETASHRHPKAGRSYAAMPHFSTAMH